MDKNIEESLKEATKYLNGVEQDGEVSINIADRILSSCRCFIHDPHLKELEDFEKKEQAEYEVKIHEAKDENEKEPETYMKYLNMAQYLLNLRLEKTQRMISFLHRLNQKL